MNYKYDLHVHTSESSICGQVNAEDVIEKYYQKGYQGLAITDHYNNDFFSQYPDLAWSEKIDHFLVGYKIALEKAKQKDMDIFLAIEYRSNESLNDYLIYGLNEDFLYKNENLHELTFPEAAAIFKENGALIIQAHPFRPKVSNLDYPYLLDGIERHNGNSVHSYDLDKTTKAIDENGYIALSNSDFHQHADLARGGNIFESRLEDIHDSVNKLKSNEFSIMIEE